MRAAILTQIGAPLELVDLTLPDRLAFGQVHVQIEYSGICGAQLGEIDGVKGPDTFLPHCLGHEGVGTVKAIGEGVKTVAVGDTVVLHWRPSDGLQSDPPIYTRNGIAVNAGWVTTFQEEAIVSENRVTKLPMSWYNNTTAPLLGCALTTAYGVVTRDADVKPGQSVLVFGAGGVGLSIIQIALLVSAEICAVDPVSEKRAAVGKLHVETAKEAPTDRVFDVVIDTTGRSGVIETAYRLTKPHGKTILVGVPKHDDPITIHSLPLHFDRVLKGSHGGDACPQHDIPLLASLVASDKLKLDHAVTHIMPLERVNQAIYLVRSGEAGRVLLRMAN